MGIHAYLGTSLSQYFPNHMASENLTLAAEWGRID